MRVVTYCAVLFKYSVDLMCTRLSFTATKFRIHPSFDLYNSTDYTASYPRRRYSSKPPLWKPQTLLYPWCFWLYRLSCSTYWNRNSSVLWELPMMFQPELSQKGLVRKQAWPTFPPSRGCKCASHDVLWAAVGWLGPSGGGQRFSKTVRNRHSIYKLPKITENCSLHCSILFLLIQIDCITKPVSVRGRLRLVRRSATAAARPSARAA
jgi:hypothetical protein